ncbi:MAG: hypothetical protein ACO3UM_07845 [Planctomycetota bacterium]
MMNKATSAALALLLAAPACHDKSTGKNTDEAAKLTLDTVTALFDGSDDFEAMRDDLFTATRLDTSNVDAQVLFATVVALDEVKTCTEAQHRFRQTFERAGILFLDGATFWDLMLALEEHSEGLFKDDFPTFDEFVTILIDDVLPVLDVVSAALAEVPEDWEYVIPVERGGKFLAWLSPGDPHAIRLDHADAMAALALVEALRALIEGITVYDYDGLSLAEFDILDDPTIDPIDVIDTEHPGFGTLLRTQNLTRLRDRLRDCFLCYESCMEQVRTENQERQREGLMSMARLEQWVPDATQRQLMLQQEEQLRTWLRAMVGALDGTFTISTLPDGTTLPVDQQIVLDFRRLFAGVDLRALYIKTQVDPWTGRKLFGVPALAALTAEMASFGGTLVSIGGVAPSPGTLQEEPGYALVLDESAVTTATKTIDGDLGDWDRDRDRIMLRTQDRLWESRPDLGEVFTSVDATDVYLLLDEDLTQHLVEPTDTYEILVEWDTGLQARVTYQNRAHFGDGGAGYAHRQGPDGGIECRFPIEGEWARIRVRVEARNTSWDFEAMRGPVYLQAR